MSEHDYKSERDTCKIADSSLCDRLSKNGCQNCYIRSLKSDEQKEEALQRWQQTLALIPRTIDDLHESEDCQFCKGDIHKKDGYALLEMAHAEPYYEKGMFFGFGKKVRTPVGSLVMLQISVCKRCRKVFRMIDMLQILIFIASIALAIAFLAIPAIGGQLAKISPLMPFLLLAAIGVAGYFLGDSIAQQYARSAAKKVKLDLTEIPKINEMIHRGWFFFQTNKERPRMSFSKKKQQPRLFLKEEHNEDDNDDSPLDNINI